MRTLTQNKQRLYYSLLLGTTPVYRLDENGNRIVDFIDENGNIFYQVTGEEKPLYSDPVPFDVNISFGGGDVQNAEFGIDVTAYDATIVYLLHEFPIAETSILWFQTRPQYVGANDSRVLDYTSADYKVLSVKNSLNYTKVLLGKLAK